MMLMMHRCSAVLVAEVADAIGPTHARVP